MLAGGALGVGLTESGLLGGLSIHENNKVNDRKAQELCETYADSWKNDQGNTDAKNLAIKYCEQVMGSGAGCQNSSATTIHDLCNKADVKTASNTGAVRWAVPVATSLGAGALGAGITASVIKQKKENIKNEAAQKWMDEIGEHIQCYLGTDELGTYGDVVSIELD